MDKLDYYRKRFYAFYNALSILEGKDTKIYMDNTWKAGFDAAFEKKKISNILKRLIRKLLDLLMNILWNIVVRLTDVLRLRLVLMQKKLKRNA